MTNYEKIKFLLEMGVYKGVEVMYDGEIVICLEMSKKGRIYTNMGGYYTEEQIQKLDIRLLEPIPNPPKLLPVGTKVRVFENYKGIYLDKNKETVYEISMYGDCKNTYFIGRVKKYGGIFEVPARAVVPVLY